MKRRVTCVLWIAAVAALAARAGAQSKLPGDDSTKASLYNFDLTIPDAPAFALLQVDESRAIQPGTVRDLALALSGFSTPDNQFRIPASLAVEAAPLLLVAREMTVSDYQQRAWASRTRLSVASKGGDGPQAVTQLAFGVRTTLFDHTDPRDASNDAFRVTAYRFIDRLVCNDVATYLASRGINPRLESTSQEVVAALNRIPDRAERKKVGEQLARMRSDSCQADGTTAATETAEQRAATKARLLASLDSLQKDFEERHWNAFKVELAAALGGASRDSTGRDPFVERQEGWLGVMLPFGPLEGTRTWRSNVGLGATAVISRSRDSVTNRLATGFIGAARLVGGGNVLRGFGEGQYSSTGSGKGFLANIGAELRIVEGVWLQLSAGYTGDRSDSAEASGNARHWVTGFQVRGAPQIGGFFGLK